MESTLYVPVSFSWKLPLPCPPVPTLLASAWSSVMPHQTWPLSMDVTDLQWLCHPSGLPGAPLTTLISWFQPSLHWYCRPIQLTKWFTNYKCFNTSYFKNHPYPNETCCLWMVELYVLQMADLAIQVSELPLLGAARANSTGRTMWRVSQNTDTIFT